MKIKTAEATKLQLDWGLALAVGGNPEIQRGKVYVPFAFMEGAALKLYRHTEPAVCMDACFKFGLIVNYEKPSARTQDGKPFMFGSTPAEAVARCVIAMQLGDEFECPDELGVML